MPSADQVIAWFEANNGLREDPNGSNCTWLSRWFWEQTDRHSALAPGCYAWCAVTVSRALNEAWGNADVWQVPGVRADWRPGFAWVPGVRAAFERAGLYTTNHGEARRGDLVIFDWDGDGWGDHIGVLLADLGDGTSHVWEGNTSDNDLSLRRRPHNLIAGYCRVPYDNTPGGGFLMALSDAQQDELYAKVNDLHDYMSHVRKGDGGGPNLDGVEVETRDRVRGLGGGGGNGGAVDYDLLAEKVAANIAARLEK